MFRNFSPSGRGEPLPKCVIVEKLQQFLGQLSGVFLLDYEPVPPVFQVHDLG
jgi:hypothetical protein